MRALILLVFAMLITPAYAFLQPGVTTTTPPTSCPYTPPLDIKAAKVAYSFQALSSSWIGGNAVRIQRSSDSTQKTFTVSLPTCAIDQTDSFFDGSTYTIVTWYDQSGNGKNATPHNSPTVILNCKNGLPCVHEVSASSQYISSNTGLTFTTVTHAIVAQLTDTSASHFISYVGDGTGNNFTGLFHSSGSAAIKLRRANAGVLKDSTSPDSVNVWYAMIGTGTGNLSSSYLNSVQGTDDLNAQAIAAGGLVCIGCVAPTTPATYMQGNIGEFIIFSPALSITDSNTISANQSGRWNTP